MANTTVYTYDLDGTTKDFNIPFEYLARRFVVVTLIGTDRRELVLTTDYRFTAKTSVQTTVAWSTADGYDLIEVRRTTSATDRLVDFTDGSILRAYELNTAQIQTMHIAEEARNLTADTIAVNNDGMLDARARRIVNLGDAIDPGDAVTLRQEQAWGNSALNQADRSKAEADRSTTKATESANSATAAKTSETNSKTSETNSKTSETNSKTSETNSSASTAKAQKWADEAVDVAVETGKYSAKHHATKASASETAAKTSETNAKTSETNAKTSETNAQAWAAGVNMPSALGQGNKLVRQKADESGFEYADAASMRGTLELGTAATKVVQTSKTDTTAGALMAVEACGLGAGMVPDVADANKVMTTGFYRMIGDTLNRPETGTAGYALEVIGYSSTYTWQRASKPNGSSTLSFTRWQNGNGVWSSWHPDYNASNIRGTVSQASGVPTGAIIERGSNANGEYTKFADGTMECWRFWDLGSLSLAAGGLSAGYTWTFPAAFVGTSPAVNINNVSGWTYEYLAGYESLGTSSTGGIYIKNIGQSSRAQGHHLALSAKGRWF